MNGLAFDFETNDISLTPSGGFKTGTIDSQNCALISVSKTCRITAAEVGANLSVEILNRKGVNVQPLLTEAVLMVEADGGKNVTVELNGSELYFAAKYE